MFARTETIILTFSLLQQQKSVYLCTRKKFSDNKFHQKRKKMKKIMMTIAAAMVAVTMNAQDMYVGGSLGFSTTTHDGNTLDTEFTFSPEFGISFSENAGVGLEFGYGRDEDKSGSTKVVTNALSVAPYFRWTPFHIGPVNLFADAKFRYGFAKVESDGQDAKTNTWGLYLQPGVAYNLNDKFSLVAKFGDILSYRSSKPDYSGAKSTNTFSALKLTNNISFGFYYNF